jgi:TonB family protein
VVASETGNAAWQVFPWIGALAFHVALLAVLAMVVVSLPHRIVPETGIDISLDSSTGRETPQGENAGPGPSKSIPPVSAKAPVQSRVSGDSPQRVEIDDGLPSTAPAEKAPPMLTAVMPVHEAAPEDSGTKPQQGARIGWEGSARKLIHKRDPAFPAKLSAAGQEVECEARITVAASGVVTRVEITRSSGYIEIDASVEAALRDYLFSRASERKDAVGTIKFRFRLERQD